MIRIDPDTIYTRSDLAGLLEPAGVDVDTFIARLRPRKVFRRLWLGEDILAAYRAAPMASGHDERLTPSLPAAQNHRKPQRRRKATEDELLAPLNQLLHKD